MSPALLRGMRDAMSRAVADRRIGRTPADQLRWLIAFTERDLTLLHPAERGALGYDLEFLVFRVMPRGYQGGGPFGATPDEVAQIQRELRDGLRAIFAGGWRLPRADVETLEREHDGRIQGWKHVSSLRARVAHATAELLRVVGPHFRQCPQCGQPFVGRKRQAYCSARCSQLTRDQRRGVSPPPAGRTNR